MHCQRFEVSTTNINFEDKTTMQVKNLRDFIIPTPFIILTPPKVICSSFAEEDPCLYAYEASSYQLRLSSWQYVDCERAVAARAIGHYGQCPPSEK